ncbi:uncharacterized protein LOC113169502 isoform X2 [Anabas testudineus]|uniref:uncharacterized protein LOC113169502 isoform X2 n=1 Tax=Anabas testudineus TaxID=64144 RepID=UPI000E4638B3|nr:uncharacterized protein LOC113169502 isoform X2 [Anabas testudineus]
MMISAALRLWNRFTRRRGSVRPRANTMMAKTLSDSSSESKVKQCVDVKQPSLIQRVEMLTSVIELLLETLEELNDQELKNFRKCLHHIQSNKHHSNIQSRMELQDTVFLIVQICGKESMETTKEILDEMKRNNMLRKLSVKTSESKKKPFVDKDLSTTIHKVAAMVAVKELLLETLSGLTHKELKTFKWFLQFTLFQKCLPLLPWRQLEWADMAEIVDVMMETHGLRIVEVTTEILTDMKMTDLVQWLSETSSGFEDSELFTEAFGVKTTVEEKNECCSESIQKVETMMSVIELLLETLAALNNTELNYFKLLICELYPHSSHSGIMSMLSMTELQDTVFLMVQVYGQQSVEMTREVLEEMKRTDLLPMLSDNSKKKHHSALIHKVATMAAVHQLILETLNDLSFEEHKDFKELLKSTVSQKRPPNFWYLKKTVGNKEIVAFIVQTFGMESVEVMKKVLMDINRTDLEERLSGTSSEPKEKHCLHKPGPALFERILLETLKHLNHMEFVAFKWFLQFTYFHKGQPLIPWQRLEMAKRGRTVYLIMKRHAEQSVEVTMEVLRVLKRADLLKRLSETSSGFKGLELSAETLGVKTTEEEKDKFFFSSTQKVEMMVSVIEQLLETLACLSNTELNYFKQLIHQTSPHSSHSDIQGEMLLEAELQPTVFSMLQIYGQQSVEKTKTVLKIMKRADLVESLSDSKSKPKKKLSVDERHSALIHKVATMAAVYQLILETLNDLRHKELKEFKRLLQLTVSQKSLSDSSCYLRQTGDGTEIVASIVQSFGQKSVEVTKQVLMDMNRADLVQRLSETNPETKEKHSSLLIQKNSSDWTELEPEVSCTDKSSTYSLNSEAGNFECSISGLRWICKDKVTFKYQFCSWEDPMERMESIQYMPAGSLIDITVIAGKLDEVYLPHWICIDDNPKILDKFAVLHIDECGDVVEKASEVTPSHVKLSEPIFSPRAVLMRAGFPVKINCKVLIYKANTAFLTLHVYLMPCDPGLEQAMEKRELSYGYRVIRKPHPEQSLKMYDRFILKADLDGAEIYPNNLKLRYESRNPNFFEMFIENPDKNFKLSLTQKDDPQPVWTCVIRKDEYQSTGHRQEKKSVDEHQPEPIKKVKTITKVREDILKMLEQLKDEELKEFKWHLKNSDIGEHLPCIPSSRLEKTDMWDLVDLMLQTYNQQSVEVTKRVFKKIKRNDLVQMLLNSSSGTQEKHIVD